MAAYKTKINRFLLVGLLLAAAGDTLSVGQYQILKNIRSNLNGVLTSRPGMVAINSSAVNAINTIRRLNNDLSGASQAFARIISGAGSLYSDNSAHTTFTSRASGFSSNPLTLVPFRPSESPEP